jgi:creatinine amidohydrolase
MGQFCSGYDTSQKWQLNESGIAIMPMGATEQHGSHLPLNTDTITASYFAEYVAKELHAMLLPPMPFGTSLEHAGFRGTISLKPEVLISFIQNITDELEAQNIRFFIIMNGHGGNFAMSPAVRQINRQDRKIKVLIINCWEFQNHPSKQPEVHAGEGETSLMLAIDKKLVGDLNVPISNPSLQAENFKQSDLNTFGVGRMTPHGIWGCPQHATQEKGKKQIADIKKNIVPFILERIKRLDKDPRYGGPGPIVLRPFHDSDIPFGMFVKNQANWNQLEQDWQMILETNQNGHFIAMQNGLPVGTATTINYSNRFCWVGMVLVDSTKRRSGIGKTLLINAIEQAKKIGTVRLDATPDGKKTIRYPRF